MKNSSNEILAMLPEKLETIEYNAGSRSLKINGKEFANKCVFFNLGQECDRSRLIFDTGDEIVWIGYGIHGKLEGQPTITKSLYDRRKEVKE